MIEMLYFFLRLMIFLSTCIQGQLVHILGQLLFSIEEFYVAFLYHFAIKNCFSQSISTEREILINDRTKLFITQSFSFIDILIFTITLQRLLHTLISFGQIAQSIIECYMPMLAPILRPKKELTRQRSKIDDLAPDKLVKKGSCSSCKIIIWNIGT